MAKFDVDVEGATYEVDAPDENTAWRWANETHKQSPKIPQKTGMDLMRDKSVPLGQRMGEHGVPFDGKSPNELMDEAANWVGGKVVDATGSPMLGTVANTALQAWPMVFGGNVGNKINSVGRALSEKLMQKAISPTLQDLQRGKAQRAAALFLDKLELPTTGGVSRLKNEASDIGNQVSQELSRVGGTIPKNSPPTRIQDEIAKLEDVNALPSGPRAAMEKVNDEFLSNPLIPNDIPLDRAQKFKQTLYQDLKNKYGTLSEGQDAAKKALARGLREDIEQVAPNVAPLNAKASELWNAINVSERKALLEANKDLLGLTPFAASPVYGAAHALSRSNLARALLAHGVNIPTSPIPSKLAAQLGLGLASIDEPQGAK